jgi:hypothetical protein
MTIRPPESAESNVLSPSATTAARFALSAACAALLASEAIGTIVMWALAPLGWLWVGGRAYRATGSLFADLAVVICGLLVTTWFLIVALQRVDRAWIALRRRGGHDQADGALDRVVVVSTTAALALFLLWYYVLAGAFVMPFMPMR